MLDPITPLLIVLIPPAPPELSVDQQLLDAALVRRGIDPLSTPFKVQLHAENTPVDLDDFNGRVVTVRLDEITRAQPNWTVEGSR
ncbi:hypothetical protein EBZ37_12305 [bacterium]|nr:hypothetical protein [bacterium]